MCPRRGWQGAAKRAIDLILAIGGLVLLGPLLLLLALAIRLESPGPVLFRQLRYGLGNRPIEVLKFRTMYHHLADPTGEQQTVRSDPRVTRIGRLLRFTSIDELPQLINVLKGEMSIVGPRPHAISMKVENCYYHEVVPFYFERHKVRPGITGLAQILGYRGEVDTIKKARKRVEWDMEYVEKWSLKLDMSILIVTILMLPFDENAY